MKLAKNFAATALLVFAISLPSYGGDQQTPGATCPPPRPEPPRTATAVTEETSVEQQMTDILWYEVVVGLLSIYG